MKDIKDIIKELPSSWEEITLGQFTKFLDIKIHEDKNGTEIYEDFLQVASVLTDTPLEYFDDVNMKDINIIINKLGFILTKIPEKKTDKFKWKKLEEITMDDYISYTQLEERYLYNLQVFIKNFNKKEFTEQEILSFPITEVMYGFFLYKRYLRKYLHRLMILEGRKILLHRIKLKAINLLRKVTFKEKTEK